MLTIAYSDLEVAVDALNTGAICCYFVRPWNVRAIRGMTLRGIDAYLVRSELDRVARERDGLLRRLAVADRVRGMTVLAAGLSRHVRNPLAALCAFLDRVPQSPRAEGDGDVSARARRTPEALQERARRESARILEYVERVAEVVVAPRARFESLASMETVVRAALARLAASGAGAEARVDVAIDARTPALRGDAAMLERTCHLLVARLLRIESGTAGAVVRVYPGQTARGAPAAVVRFRVATDAHPPDWLAAPAGSSAADDEEAGPHGPDLLAAFLVAHHHGGELRIHTEPPDGPGFELVLPGDPEAAGAPEVGLEAARRILTQAV
jgi:two-component system probable response regulator PhcQ